MNTIKKIPVIYSGDHYLHDPEFEIYDGVKEPYAEKADRLTSIVASLKEGGYVLENPKEFSLRQINTLHQPRYVEYVKSRSQKLKDGDVLYPSNFIMDTYTPITSGTFQAAKSSVDVALTGAQKILKGESVVYSLCRPPGHHAEYKVMGGYCYFNNAAIAAEYLSKKGRVAILDIDFHHGNGTQQLFYGRDDVLYLSLHADPAVKFPYNSGFADEDGEGKGKGFTKNFPLPLGITDERYLEVLQKSLRIIKAFSPDFLVVSLGFDTYEKDPIGGFALTLPFYKKMGQEIARVGLPTLLVQEGGYFVSDLGKMSLNFIEGIQNRE